jgi:hypothetical protein
MNYAIQCTDTLTGLKGCFGFDTNEYMAADAPLQFKARTPIFDSLSALFVWVNNEGIDLYMYPVVWGEGR